MGEYSSKREYIRDNRANNGEFSGTTKNKS